MTDTLEQYSVGSASAEFSQLFIKLRSNFVGNVLAREGIDNRTLLSVRILRRAGSVVSGSWWDKPKHITLDFVFC